MSDDKEQRIREQAHALWEKEGSPQGRDLEFWERARLLVEAPAQSDGTAAPTADDEVDVAMKETFPASDPPAFTADRGAMTG